jgi:hypothetical protein
MARRDRRERRDREPGRAVGRSASRPGGQRAERATPSLVADPGPIGWIGWLITTGCGAIAFLLYLFTLAPTVAAGDSGELTTVALSLGLAHPPGYPTFTMLGHLFSLLPLGSDPAYRVNLMSAVLDAVAVGIVVLIVGRLVGSAMAAGTPASPDDDGGAPGSTGTRALLPWLAGAAAGLSLAVSTAFWQYSLVAEVFALNNLLATMLLLAMLEWSRRPDRMRFLWAAGLVGGLALTNQQTIVFVAPALLVLFGLGLDRYMRPTLGGRGGERSVPWLALAIALVCGLVGLSPYAYMPIATANGAATIWGDPRTLDGLLSILTRSAYGTFSFTVRETSGSLIEQVGLFLGYLWSAFTPVGVGIAAVGAAWLTLRRTVEAFALWAWLLMAGLIFVLLANPPLTDPVTRGVLERFYILPSIPVAIFVGVGTWRLALLAGEALARAGRHPSPQARPRLVVVAVAAAVAVAPLGLAAARIPDVNQDSNRLVSRYAMDLLDPLPPGALLLMRGDENYTTVLYAQEVVGMRPDVIALDTELLKLNGYVDQARLEHPDLVIPFSSYDGGRATTISDLIDRAIDSRPVFVVGQMQEDLARRFDLSVVGLASRVYPNGQVSYDLAGLRADPGQLDRLHVPDRAWPETTWEEAITAHYADLAFHTGVALQALGPQPDAAEVERFYRTAIRLNPWLPAAYKNLGILLQTNAGSPSEIVRVWEEYLQLNPGDPEAAAIRSQIERLKTR